PHLREVLNKVAGRGAKNAAILIRQWMGQVFSYAIIHDICDNNPALYLKGLIKRPTVRHHPPLSWTELPVFLNSLDHLPGQRSTIIALRLMALTFVRTVELRKARWSEFDLDGALWQIPKARMKMRRPHIVPLSVQ